MTDFAGTASFILDAEDTQIKVNATLVLIDKVFYTAMSKIFTKKDFDSVYLNKHILAHAVKSYYCDLFRLTIFRGITADRHKQSAFLIKWLVMLRPVQIHADSIPQSEAVLLANEYLAVTVGLIILFRSVSKHLAIIADEWQYIHNLVYLLHYHSCMSPEQLASELYQLEQNYL